MVDLTFLEMTTKLNSWQTRLPKTAVSWPSQVNSPSFKELAQLLPSQFPPQPQPQPPLPLSSLPQQLALAQPPPVDQALVPQLHPAPVAPVAPPLDPPPVHLTS